MFAPRLRALRTERGLTQARLAELLNAELKRETFTASDISRYERGARVPTSPTMRALSSVLAVELTSLEDPRSSPQHPELSELLRELRRSEDTHGANAVVGAVRIGAGMTPDGSELRASYEQFLGWLAVDLGDFRAALAHHKRVDAIGRHLVSDDLITTARSMRAHLAILCGEPLVARRLAVPSGHPSPSVSALLHQMRARAAGMLGDVREMTRQTLRSERELTGPDFVYFVDPTRLEIQRGVAELAAGNARSAAKALARTAELPAGYRRDRARYGAMWARSLVMLGEREQARSVLNSLPDVESHLGRHERTRSALLLTD